jgi:hypothetical protein
VSEFIPDEYIGVWHRESVQVEGQEPFEDSQVVWLQARSRYADVRVALPDYQVEPESFGGSITWSEPQLTFAHQIDLTNRFPNDMGRLHFEGDVLVEEGSVEIGGRTIAYRERWQRQSSVDPDYVVFESRGRGGLTEGLAVRVGDRGIIMQCVEGFSSCYVDLSAPEPQRLWGVGALPDGHIPQDAEPGDRYTICGLPFLCIEHSCT